VKKVDSQDNLAEILANIEEIIGAHYKIYAEKFQDHKDFWNTLAMEEGNHAQWIRDVYSKVKDGLVTFNEKRFNKESVIEFKNHLHDALSYIREKNISLKEALMDSLKIERMVLERNFFEAFQTDSSKLNEKLERIIEDTKTHRTRIEQLLEKTS
jgi:rubrerythrin